MKVLYAGYGGVDSNSTFKTKDVTAHLQSLLDGGTTAIRPTMFEDPFYGIHKGFYAQVKWTDGSDVVFLCTDYGQTIDFSKKPVPKTPSPAVAPTGAVTVNKAWYGTSVPTGNVQNQQDVTGALQQMINQNAKRVRITSLPDPAFGYHKALFVNFSINGERHTSVISDYTTWEIDFTTMAVAPSGKRALNLNNLSLVYFGKPTPQSNYVFSRCQFKITNKAVSAFPPDAQVSGWVSVDFYASTTNTATSLSSMTKIGEFPAQLGSPALAASGNKGFDLTNYQLNGMSQDVFIKGRLNSDLYYVYAQVKNDENAMTGMFSGTTYQLPPV